jgi:DNA-directed RNA polymerase subunit RPC12/RpoP
MSEMKSFRSQGLAAEPVNAEAPAAALQRDFTCRTCAGSMTFDPERQALRCGHCAGEVVISTTTGRAHQEVCLERAAQQISFDPGVSAVAYTCQTCAGEIVFLGQNLSARCPYCDGPVVRKVAASGFAPAGLAPFRIVEKAARDAMSAWFRSRWLMPTSLQDRAMGARLAGVYAPFWTFDAAVKVRYVGQRGRKSGKNMHWTTVSGTLDAPFDDILMPASHHITPDIRDATGPWPVTRLIDFEPKFLAGFAAELHRVPPQDAAALAREDIRPILEEKVRRAIGGQRQRITSMEIELQGTTCRSMLLPLWILHYNHEEQPYRVIASGVSGRAFGERPFCATKVRIASLIATLGASLLGAAIGLLHAAAG